MKITALGYAAASALVLSACVPMDRGTNSPASPPVAEPGQCRADQYQTYVGRNRSELPARPPAETWRVTCTTCPVTMDFNPSRLNILYDETSGVIREVKCG